MYETRIDGKPYRLFDIAANGRYWFVGEEKGDAIALGRALPGIKGVEQRAQIKEIFDTCNDSLRRIHHKNQGIWVDADNIVFCNLFDKLIKYKEGVWSYADERLVTYGEPYKYKGGYLDIYHLPKKSSAFDIKERSSFKWDTEKRQNFLEKVSAFPWAYTYQKMAFIGWVYLARIYDAFDVKPSVAVFGPYRKSRKKLVSFLVDLMTLPGGHKTVHEEDARRWDVNDFHKKFLSFAQPFVLTDLNQSQSHHKLVEMILWSGHNSDNTYVKCAQWNPLEDPFGFKSEANPDFKYQCRVDHFRFQTLAFFESDVMVVPKQRINRFITGLELVRDEAPTYPKETMQSLGLSMLFDSIEKATSGAIHEFVMRAQALLSTKLNILNEEDIAQFSHLLGGYLASMNCTKISEQRKIGKRFCESLLPVLYLKTRLKCQHLTYDEALERAY